MSTVDEVAGAPPVLSDDEVKNLKKAGKNLKDRKKAETKEILATKEKLASRVARRFDVRVDVGDNEVYVFKARRLSEKERVTMNNVRRNIADPSMLTDEEYDILQKQGYELLSIVIVEPPMSVEEWEEVDLALVQVLLEKISVLQYEANDAKVIDDLRNL
jgi:hypothetical protein